MAIVTPMFYKTLANKCSINRFFGRQSFEYAPPETYAPSLNVVELRASKNPVATQGTPPNIFRIDCPRHDQGFGIAGPL